MVAIEFPEYAIVTVFELLSYEVDIWLPATSYTTVLFVPN